MNTTADDGRPGDQASDSHCDDLYDEEIIALYVKEADRLERFVVSLGADHSTARDVVHDAFLATRRYWRNARGHAEAYLYMVARRRWYRLRKLGGREFLGGEDSFREVPDQAADFEGRAADLDVQAAVAKLPARQREAIRLHYLHDFSVNKAAEIMRVKPGTVKALLSQARARLADLLGGDPAEDRP